VSEHNQHYVDSDTGMAECECCCGWALDLERERKDHTEEIRRKDDALVTLAQQHAQSGVDMARIEALAKQLASALDGVMMAADLPGDHCEYEDTKPIAVEALYAWLNHNNQNPK